MATTTPLTDAINSLTTYSNSVTGASDTDLSSAVATLVAGYGGGGASNIMVGTFTCTTYGETLTINTGYTGNGYPIAMMIYTPEGYNNTSGAFGSTIAYGAGSVFSHVKKDATIAPTWNNNLASDGGLILGSAKDSSSNSAMQNHFYSATERLFYGSVSNSDPQKMVKMPTATSFNVICRPDTTSKSYGFLINIPYIWMVVYSE
jgi:hypothetical protein